MNVFHAPADGPAPASPADALGLLHEEGAAADAPPRVRRWQLQADAWLLSGRRCRATVRWSEVPEEGARLVVAWLRAHGAIDAAARVLTEIEPWLAKLRFYPVPDRAPAADTQTVRRQDLAVTLKTLGVDRRQPRIEAMREAIRESEAAVAGRPGMQLLLAYSLINAPDASSDMGQEGVRAYGQGRDAVRHELRDHGDVEHADLGIQQVRERAAAVGSPP